MSGFITKVECEANKQFIIDTWGEEFYNKCLDCVGQTFLGLLCAEGKI